MERKVDLIVTASTPAIIAAKRATDKIPVVFAASSDPLSTGVVTSLAKPGGNITGLSLMASDLSAKRLELIHTLVPRVNNIAVLWDSSNPGMALRVRETRAAAESSKIEFFDAGARNLDELTAMLSELSKRKPWRWWSQQNRSRWSTGLAFSILWRHSRDVRRGQIRRGWRPDVVRAECA